MKLNQITLPCNAMQETVDFYTALGCKLIVDTPHYARFLSPEGDSTFSLALDTEHFSNGAVMYFEHEDLDGLVRTLKERDIQFAQEPKDEPYLWREAVLYDPSGNKIKLYWAGENRLNPPWKVTD